MSGARQTQQRPRPSSAHEHRGAGPPVGGAAAAVRALPSGGNVSVRNGSGNVIAGQVVVDPEPDPLAFEPCPPSQPRIGSSRAGSGRSFPRSGAALVSGAGSAETPVIADCVDGTMLPGDISADLLSREDSRMMSEGDSGIMLDGGDGQVVSTRQRLLRPTSAKASKHKRVAENQEKPTVYEDYEDSEPDDDALNIEDSVFEGPILESTEAAQAEATHIDQMQTSPAACSAVSPSGPSSGVWPGVAWAGREAESPSVSQEPRASTPPPRRRLAA